MKYIDADKLIAEIEQLKETNKVSTKKVSEYVQGGIYGFDLAIEKIVTIITSLQQEQPEVDLEKEITDYFQGYWPGTETPEQCNTDMHFTPPAIMRLVEHFFELGLNARKEE